MDNAKEIIIGLDKKIILYSEKFIYFALIFMPFVASFSSALVNILIGFLIFAFLVNKTLKKDFSLPKTVINIPFFFLILISLFSMRNSLDIYSSIRGVLKLFKYGWLFLIVSESVTDVKHLKRIIIALACGLLLSSIDAVYQLQFGKDFIRNHAYDFIISLPRAKATFPHTNLFALYLVLMLPVCLSCGLYYFKGKIRMFFLIVSILSLFSLIFTFGRGAIISFLVAVILIAILRKDKLLLTIIVIALVITPFILPPSIKEWIKSTKSIGEVILSSDAGPERIYIYKTALNMAKQHPFIGVGVNTFCLNYLTYKAGRDEGNVDEGRYYGHNNFLHMAGEIGLIGLGIFLWLLVALFKKWYKIYKSLPAGGFLKIASLGLISGIIAFLINGMTESGLYYSKVATLFWFQIGLVLVILKLGKNESDKNREGR